MATLINTRSSVYLVDNDAITYEIEVSAPIRNIVRTTVEHALAITESNTLIKMEIKEHGFVITPIEQYISNVNKIWFESSGPFKGLLFIQSENNSIYSSYLDTFEDIHRPKHLIQMTMNILDMIFKDTLWHVIYVNENGNTMLKMYDMFFTKELCEPLQLCNESIEHIIIPGCKIVYSIKNELYIHDILTGSTTILYSFDKSITGVTCNESYIYITLNNDLVYVENLNAVFACGKLSFGHINIAFGSIISEVYAFPNDIHWGVTPVNSSYVNCIHKDYLQSLFDDVDIASSSNNTDVKISNNIASDIYPNVNISNLNFRVAQQKHNFMFNKEDSITLEKGDGVMWRLLDLKVANMFECVHSTDKSYFLYIHPLTGWTHAVLDHDDFIKVFKTTEEKPFFISMICLEGLRVSVCYHEMGDLSPESQTQIKESKNA